MTCSEPSVWVVSAGCCSSEQRSVVLDTEMAGVGACALASLAAAARRVLVDIVGIRDVVPVDARRLETSVPVHVTHVARLRIPSQIVGPIIVPITVIVASEKPLWSWAVEGFEDELVDFPASSWSSVYAAH